MHPRMNPLIFIIIITIIVTIVFILSSPLLLPPPHSTLSLFRIRVRVTLARSPAYCLFPSIC